MDNRNRVSFALFEIADVLSDFAEGQSNKEERYFNVLRNSLPTPGNALRRVAHLLTSIAFDIGKNCSNCDCMPCRCMKNRSNLEREIIYQAMNWCDADQSLRGDADQSLRDAVDALNKFDKSTRS